ncbi:hypothetical protein [Pseudomonas sp. R5(2019)]|nr:hypothetical protein [Pseudomonas sp. R5(2019)]
MLGLCLALTWMVQVQHSLSHVRGTQAEGQPLVSAQQLFWR